MLRSDTLYLLALSLLGIRIQRAYLKQKDNLSAHDFYHTLSPAALKTIAEIEAVYGSSPLDAAKKILDECSLRNFKVYSFGDSEYPYLLSQIDDPPLVLYSSSALFTTRCVAIVGTREADRDSAASARNLAARLASRGICIVSGMARGIDRAAHEGALNEGGASIGVLGGGIDTVYPRSNSDLYLAMQKEANTLLLSEFPPKVSVKKWAFVKRNRIISGLSEGVVVVKAAKKSGALITADFASEQNREVFACCSLPFNDEYEGCIRLVNEGAYCLYDETTVCDVLNINSAGDSKTKEHIIPDDPILQSIASGIHDIDEIGRCLDIEQSRFQQKLTELELNQRIVRSGNRVFFRRSEL